MVELTVTVVVSGLGSGRLCVCYGVWIRGRKMGGGKGTLGELLSVWGSKPAHLFDPPPGAQAAAIPSNPKQSPTNWSNIQTVHKECIKLHRNRIKYTESISKRYSLGL